MSGSSLATLAALQSPEGLRLQARVRELAPTPATELKVNQTLRQEFDPALVAAALTLHALRARAATKFSRADTLYLTRAGLEQATGETIARYRAARFAGRGPVADLCCGIGGDLVALAASHDVLAIDRDPVHLAMAVANARVYGVADRVRAVAADVRDAALDGIDGIFIDPARRTGAGRLRTGESEPPLAWVIALAARVPAVCIKAAPGIDHARVPPGWELELIADGIDLKEAVLWSPALATAPRRATILAGKAVHTLLPVPGEPVPVIAPGAWLLDPNPAVTRAGLVEDLARSLGVAKIDDHIAFLTAETPTVIPFARTLRVLASLPWHEKRLRAALRELDVGPIDIRRRGLAGDVDALTRRLRGDGNRRVTVAMTRAAGQPWAVICEDLRPAQTGRRRGLAGVDERCPDGDRTGTKVGRSAP